MTTVLAVELNDAGLQLARVTDTHPAELLGGPGPGFALLQNGRVLVGEEAARLHRTAPLYAQNRFWRELSVEPLTWSARGIATHADLAHAQLAGIVATATPGADAILVMAVPPGYSREQLGLLVGIANETGVPLRGLVDLGLAACAAGAPVPHVVHLDVQLHQAAITVLEYRPESGQLRRSRYELLPAAGAIAFHQALAASIASEFVRQTRFDPLHEAATEQRLHDLLPGWIERLEAEAEIEAEMTFGTDAHRISLTRTGLVAAVEPLLAEVLRLVQSSRPAGLAVELRVSQRATALPGLVARLESLRDCCIVALPHGAAALGALAAREAIVRPADALALVHRLPVAPATDPGAAGPDARLATVPDDAIPTHVLFRGRAWAVTVEPLTLGWSTGGVLRPLPLPEGIAGLSKSHCTVVRRDGQVVVEDHSTYGTYVNDERVAGRVALRVGDVLRLGAPGVTLDLIRVVPEHGAA
jgi:hypothetical protein